MTQVLYSMLLCVRPPTPFPHPNNTRSGGAVTAGDLMMIQGLLLQLWAPLQFLGWFYRELRSALVDMEEFFAILRTESHIKVCIPVAGRARRCHVRAQRVVHPPPSHRQFCLAVSLLCKHKTRHLMPLTTTQGLAWLLDHSCSLQMTESTVPDVPL